MIIGKFQANDDFNLGGHHLKGWKFLDDIPQGGAVNGQVLAWDSVLKEWTPATLSTTNGDSVVVGWEDIVGVPTVFPPDTHTHSLADIDDWPADHGSLTGLSDRDHPVTALQQTGAVTNEVIEWNGATWLPAPVVNSVTAGTGITVSATNGDVTIGVSLVAGTGVQISGATISATHTHTTTFVVNVVLSGNGVTITTTGSAGAFSLGTACTLVKARMLADAAGTCVVVLESGTYGDWPGGMTDMTGNNDFGVSAVTKTENTTLTAWTKTFVAGSIVSFSATTTNGCTWASLDLFFEKDLTL